MTQNKLEQAHHHHVEPSNSGSQLTDPVCGMNVTEDSAHQFERDGEAFYFCSTKCLETFKHDPEKFLGKGNGRCRRRGSRCRNNLHLSDAPRDPPGSSGQLS